MTRTFKNAVSIYITFGVHILITYEFIYLFFFFVILEFESQDEENAGRTK